MWSLFFSFSIQRWIFFPFLIIRACFSLNLIHTFRMLKVLLSSIENLVNLKEKIKSVNQKNYFLKFLELNWFNIKKVYTCAIFRERLLLLILGNIKISLTEIVYISSNSCITFNIFLKYKFHTIFYTKLN